MSDFEIKRMEFIEKLKWMRVVRFLSALIALTIYFTMYKLGIFPFPFVPFVVLCFAEGVLNQPYPFIIKRVKDLYNLAFVHLFADLILISFMIHYIGGIEISFLNAIYPLVIISAAIVLSRKATFQITTLASMFFAALVGLEYFSLVPHIPLIGLKLQGHYQLGLVAANIVFFYFVAFMATYSQSVLDEKNRQIKHARDYAESLLGLIMDGLMVVGPDGRIRSINKAVTRLLKYEKEELIGESFAEKLCVPDRQRQIRAMLANFKMIKELRNFEIDLVAKGGQPVPLRMNADLMADNAAGISGILILMHDVIAERHAESVKATFLANISHELNTPLSVIKGFTRTMIERKEVTEEERVEFLQIMDEEEERLERIITDLMELAKMEVGWIQIKKEKGQFLDIVKEVTESYIQEAKKKRLIFHINIPQEMPTLYFDQDNMKKVLTHLIENAIKFTPVGEVAVEVVERPDDVLVEISDSGVVIPEQELPKVFEQFSIDKERRPTIGKMNIRLPVVKHIVEAHGGSIWVKSKPEEGTKFTFLLPKAV
jgi:PAS domain S-box-containing protein